MWRDCHHNSLPSSNSPNHVISSFVIPSRKVHKKCMFKKKDVIQKMGDTGPLLVCLTFKSISSHAHTTNQLLCDHPFVNIGYMKKKKRCQSPNYLEEAAQSNTSWHFGRHFLIVLIKQSRQGQNLGHWHSRSKLQAQKLVYATHRREGRKEKRSLYLVIQGGLFV